MATLPSPVETNSLLREVNESVRRRSSSVNSNDFVVDADTQTALSQIKSRFTGAKCDSEGFYQHEGECWNDAITMVFLFSDGLKEVIQEKLATTEIDINFIPRESIPLIIGEYTKYREDDIKRRGNTNKGPPNLTEEKILESIVFYLKFLKHRFARHYIMESDRREECRADRNPIKILHTKGKNAMMAAIFGNPAKYSNKSLKEYHNTGVSEHGANSAQNAYLINTLIHCFFPSTPTNLYSFMTYKDVLNIRDKTFSLLLMVGAFHVGCLYTCGGQDFFYENNFGPFLFPWRDILLKDKNSSNSEDIYMIFFTTLKINSNRISKLYPVIATKDNKCFTYYNNTLFNFPEGSFKIPKEFGERQTIQHTFPGAIEFSYPEKGASQRFEINSEYIKYMLPIITSNSPRYANISNKGFSFKRNARLFEGQREIQQRAINYGIPINDPRLLWVEAGKYEGNPYWKHLVTEKLTLENPYPPLTEEDRRTRRAAATNAAAHNAAAHNAAAKESANRVSANAAATAKESANRVAANAAAAANRAAAAANRAAAAANVMVSLIDRVKEMKQLYQAGKISRSEIEDLRNTLYQANMISLLLDVGLLRPVEDSALLSKLKNTKASIEGSGLPLSLLKEIIVNLHKQGSDAVLRDAGLYEVLHDLGLTGGSLRKNKRKTAKSKSYRHKRTTRSRRL